MTEVANLMQLFEMTIINVMAVDSSKQMIQLSEFYLFTN